MGGKATERVMIHNPLWMLLRDNFGPETKNTGAMTGPNNISCVWPSLAPDKREGQYEAKNTEQEKYSISNMAMTHAKCKCEIHIISDVSPVTF